MIFNLKHIFREVKFGFQRMFRGYSDEVYWGFEDYFLQVIPALKEFCEEQTKNKEFIELNPDKGMIFSETLKLIKAFEEAPQEDYWKHPSTSSRLLEYVGRNIGFYWD